MSIKQSTKYNKVAYDVFFLRGNAIAQVEPFIIDGDITIRNINHFIKILQTHFSNVNPVNTTKHDFYKLRQTNQDLEIFLNSFLCLQNKACIRNK